MTCKKKITLQEEGGADAWPAWGAANGAAILSLKRDGVEEAALWEVDAKAVLEHKDTECAVEAQTAHVFALTPRRLY
ncbi:hypothetical protein EOD39_6556 [Acipenser ruthenus]|uniref:Uncharacterized protein n=1 Tax=Acipenser ruthenus TaxID=7906 RepID=A0A444U9R2_ACIRT|nr:hypothetical protein EOD39_6556 [Acipenser ruthenus]